MIKKTTSIVTILLLILGIVIVIAKADTKKAELKKHDLRERAWSVDKSGDLLLSDLKVLKLKDYLGEKFSSKDLVATLKDDWKGSVKKQALLDAKLKEKEVALVNVKGELMPLALEDLPLTKSWNKNLAADV